MAYSLPQAKKIRKRALEVGIPQAAADFIITEESVKRAIRIAEGMKKLYDLEEPVEFCRKTNPDVSRWKSAEEDNRPVLVVPDLHAPYHHQDAIEFLLWVQEWRGCRERIVSVGDMFDFHSMSRFISETDAPSAKSEYRKACEFAEEFSDVFPQGDMVLGNHDLIPQRQMDSIGLDTSMLKANNKLYNLPDGWDIHPLYHVIEPDTWNVLVEHGIGSGGKYGCANTAKEKRCPYVQGHIHSAAAVIYSTNHENTIFGLNVGCLVDSSSLAARYGKYFTKKGVLGCGVIYSGEHAEFIPMSTWRNHRKWF